MKLEALSREHVLRAIEEEFRFGSVPEAIRLGVIAEHLRAASVLALYDSRNQPVPTIRLTRPTRSRLSHIWSEFNDLSVGTDSLIRDELRHLESLGDLVRASSGWYLGPLRLISIDSSTGLLIGGGPIQLLPYELRSALQVCGRSRVLAISEKNRVAIGRLAHQQLVDWLGGPHDDVLVWSGAFQKHVAKDMRPVDDIDDVFVYVSSRWISLAEYRGSSSTRMYRRPVMINGHKSYAYGMAKVARGTDSLPRIVASADIAKNDARRLQGAIREEQGPRAITYLDDEPLVTVMLPHSLPNPESRFLSLGWTPSGAEESKKWPKEYVFSKRLLPLLRQAFLLLGYELKERK